MAYTTINKSTEHFNTKLYTGNGSSGHAITGVGFQPDWVWIKNRTDSASHNLYDAVRGTSAGKLKSNTNTAQSYNAQDLSVFGTDGFTVGSNNEVNGSGDNMLAWNWKAGNSAGSSNTDGTTTSTVSANTTAGFSIVKYSGSSSAKTIGHGLGAVPEFIIVKTYSSGYEWAVYHKETGHGKNLYLDTTGGASNTTTFWNNTAPTNSVFSVGGQIIYTNYSGQDYIAYCFTSKPGYSKFGDYTGTGDATESPFIYTGFKPAWVLIKKTDASGNWILFDNKRPGFNLTDNFLQPDLADAEAVNNSNQRIDMLSNGFKIKGSGNATNSSGNNFIYMAFGQSLVGSNNIPATAF